MEQIRELMAKLSSQHQQEVLDFAQYLAEKKSRPKRKKLRFDWAGGLAEFKENYTSLEFKFFHLPDFRDILNSVGELLMKATIRIYDRPEKIEFPNFQVKSTTILNF